MGADYTFYVKSIESHADAFLPLNNFSCKQCANVGGQKEQKHVNIVKERPLGEKAENIFCRK